MYSLLIVENEPLELEFVKTIAEETLSAEDMIVTCRGGKTAVELAKKHRPNLIIMDIGLPEQDGMTAIEQIREFLPACCICILTGRQDFHCAQKAISHRVFEYILKPVRPIELKKALKRMCGEIDTSERQDASFKVLKKDETESFGESKQIESAIHYMKGHFRERLVLEEVAAQGYMSPQYFSRVFKKETGMTFSHYVAELKVEYACELLNTTDYPAYRISLECGFSDASYFSKVFVRHRKMTPQEYRKSTRKR